MCAQKILRQKKVNESVLYSRIHQIRYKFGGLAQLVRALALQARGHRFEPCIVHQKISTTYFILPPAYGEQRQASAKCCVKVPG